MSKSAAASAPKTTTQLPSRSAWARGPPQSTSAPTPRSQSPAPVNLPHLTHSRRPSALGQGVPIKDGVSIPRNNVGAVKQASAVTFGSIDDVSAPISSSPAPAPPIKADVVKSFGSVPATGGHVNGKPSISSRSSLAPSPSSSTPPPAPSPTPSKLDKKDISKLFQNPSSAPSSQPPSDTTSPALRPSALPPQTSAQGTSSQPSQFASHPYTAFVPGGARPPTQNSGPGGGPPRSPVYARQMPNGSGPRSQPGPNGGPSQISPAMSSPRLAPHLPSASSMPPPPPQMQPQMQPQAVGWGGYYYPGVEQQPYYMPPYSPWHIQQLPLPQHTQHHPPPGTPHGPPHSGMPMSPRSQPSTLPPGTPTQPHAVPSHHSHPPSHTSSNSISAVSSPPPTPSTANARLSATSSTFVPVGAPKSSKIVVKNAEGHEVDFSTLAKSNNGAVVSPAPPRFAAKQTSPSVAATPTTRRPQSIVRMETPEQAKRRRAEEEEKERAAAKAKADAEEKRRKEEQEKEQKAKEEEEQKRKQQEDEERAKEAERVRKEEEEKERIRLEEEEKEKERLREEQEEREREEEEERKREEAEAAEKEQKRLAEEQERQQQQEEAEKERLRLEAEAVAAAEADEQLVAPESAPLEDGEFEETEEPEETLIIEDKAKEPLRINTTVSPPPIADLQRRRPDPLDLSSAKQSVPAALPSALITARNIENLDSVPYPEGISSPKPELNKNAQKGKFRYDRDFLLQFMKLCTEKPVHMPPLDAIGLEPLSEQSALSMSRGGSGRHGRNASGAIPPSRQASVGLGISKFGQVPFGMMGNFAGSASKLSSDERFLASTSGRAASVSGATLPFGGRPQLQRTASQGGAGGVPMSSNRTRSKRGEKRGEHKAGGQQQSSYNQNQSTTGQNLSFEPVAPLQASANRWDRKSLAITDPDSPEVVDRKVKSLLNKLTMEKFDSISDQIIAWANKSEKEKDGRTLIQVIRLVFEKATDEATWSEMYARLCRKMMERISPQVQDDGIKNTDGKPITGGQLFRKYLLNRCQEDFERGWVAKEATAAAAATKALEDQAVKAANDKSKENDETVLYSDEYYAAQKAKRQGLGLIKFIGELFKLQMLTERIMHECVKKLLGNVENPEEEEIESLCKLLTTVGAIVDTPKARAHMDVYFSRMKELTKSLNVSSRMQFMLQDVIELRERKWISRNAVAAPSTIAQIHENAAKEKATQEKEAYQRQISMSRGGSRRGGDRGDFSQPGADGWAVAGNGAPRAPPKAGDLSNFGKINKNTAMTFGPSSVFAGKKEGKRESISRTSSSSNMFSMLQSTEPPVEVAKPPEPPAQRKRLILQPRSKPAAEEQGQEESTSKSESDDEEEEETTLADMTKEQAMTKIAEDLKEFFAVRNLDEAEVYFTALPPVHHFRLVDKLTSSAVEQKEADVQLVADLFSRVSSKGLVSSSAFEEGLVPTSEIIEDIAIDAPKAYIFFAMTVKASSLDEESRTRLISKSSASEKLLSLLS